jgi:hypothetical protein
MEASLLGLMPDGKIAYLNRLQAAGSAALRECPPLY